MFTISLPKEDVARRYKSTGITAWDQAVEAAKEARPGVSPVYVYGSVTESSDALTWTFEG